MIWHVSCIEARVGSLLLTTQYPWPNNIWTKKWIIYAESSYHLELLSNGPPLFCHSWTTNWTCWIDCIIGAIRENVPRLWLRKLATTTRWVAGGDPFHCWGNIPTGQLVQLPFFWSIKKMKKKIKITSAFNREKKQQKRWFSNLLSVHVAQLINKIQKSWWFNFLVV